MMQTKPTDVGNALAALLDYSRTAQRRLADDEPLHAWLLNHADHEYPFDEVTPRVKLTVEEVHTHLRTQRRRVLLHTMLRDFMGVPVAATTQAISRFAALCVPTAQTVCAQALLTQYGSAQQELITVGMGKLGGEELNVSSDIDLIYLFPEDGETNHRERAKRIEAAAYFAKLAAQSAALLDETTGDGFVFRVDTRLRPFGDEGPLAVSIDFLERYFFEQARFWERLAWLRSASMTGELAPRTRLRQLVRPFVFRRYMDYDAYSSLRELHGKIRAEGQRSGGEANIKLGRGGIRELEFFVQIQQLVRGGRDPSLQLRTTGPAIDALERAGVLKPSQAQGLRVAYPYLRRIEHFLQYENDEQTQTLPGDANAQLKLARALGYPSLDAFLSELSAVRRFVGQQFDNLSQAAEPAAVAVAPSTHDAFAHWDEAEESRRYFRALESSQRFAQLPPQSQARVQAVLRALPRTCAQVSAPLAALKRWGGLLEAICGRSAYLALLSEHPALLAHVTRVLAASGWAAQYLREHPILLDELLDVESRQTRFDPTSARGQLLTALAHASDTEVKLDTLRRFQQTELFRILLQDLDGALTVEALADDLSALADVCVDATAQTLWHEIAPDAPFPAFAVIAYGRWGGKELGYGSDLDMVFVVGDDVRFDRCAKLAQRLMSWLTTLTTAGQLYEVDTRLRPDGAAGMLLSPISAFAQYQREKAWRWEHQALSRARFAVGDAALGAQFEAVRREILTSPKDTTQLKRDVTEMRERMQAEKAHRQTGFDVKNDPGGMVDIEFLLQFLVLAHAGRAPDLVENKGNIALLHFAGEIGLLPLAKAQALADAYRTFRSFQHQSRLAGATQAVAESGAFAPERACVREAWHRLLG
jgi:glutamate-ammonia-ligase adenylyltransferase